MKHHHSHTALLVIACSTMMLVYAVYGYMRHTISASLDRVIEGRRAAVERSLSSEKQGLLAALHSQSAEDRSRAIGFFVPEDSTISFIESVEALGPSSGSAIELSAIESKPPAEGSSVGHIRVRVEARGSWSAVMKAMMLAEALPYGVSIADLRVDASEGTSAKDKSGWKATFVIDALMIRPAAQTQP